MTNIPVSHNLQLPVYSISNHKAKEKLHSLFFHYLFDVCTNLRHLLLEISSSVVLNIIFFLTFKLNMLSKFSQFTKVCFFNQ